MPLGDSAATLLVDPSEKRRDARKRRLDDKDVLT